MSILCDVTLPATDGTACTMPTPKAWRCSNGDHAPKWGRTTPGRSRSLCKCEARSSGTTPRLLPDSGPHTSITEHPEPAGLHPIRCFSQRKSRTAEIQDIHFCPPVDEEGRGETLSICECLGLSYPAGCGKAL